MSFHFATLMFLSLCDPFVMRSREGADLVGFSLWPHRAAGLCNALAAALLCFLCSSPLEQQLEMLLGLAAPAQPRAHLEKNPDCGQSCSHIKPGVTLAWLLQYGKKWVCWWAAFELLLHCCDEQAQGWLYRHGSFGESIMGKASDFITQKAAVRHQYQK